MAVKTAAWLDRPHSWQADNSRPGTFGRPLSTAIDHLSRQLSALMSFDVPGPWKLTLSREALTYSGMPVPNAVRLAKCCVLEACSSSVLCM